MLGVPSADDVDRVTSYVDPRTGFYRTRPGVEVGWWRDDDGAGGPVPEVVSEAYSWGSLTSSGASFLEALRRAGWLSLLPFALVNVAYWARPGIDKPSASRFWTAVAVRWAGLLMTAAMIGSFALVGVDLVAWQCFRGGGQVCTFAASVPVLGTIDVGGVVGFLGESGWNAPARRVLVGTVLPMLVLVGLWWLSRQSRQRYEAVPDPKAGWSGAEAEAKRAGQIAGSLDGYQPILRRERMWRGQLRVGRQMLLHLAVGVAVTVLYAALTLLIDSADSGWQGLGPVLRSESWLSLVTAMAVLAIAAAFLASALSVQDGNDFYGVAATRRALDRVARIVIWSACGLALAAYLGFVLVALLVTPESPVNEGREALVGVPFVGFIFVLLAMIVAGLTLASRGGGWPWLAAALPLAIAILTSINMPSGGIVEGGWATVAGAALLISASVGLLYVLHRTRYDGRQAWGGAGPAVILGAGVVVALVFSASLVVGIAAVLNGSQSVSQLQSSYAAQRSAGHVAIALGPSATPAAQVTAIGPVTLRDGVACLTHDGVAVVGGTVEAAGFSAIPQGPPFQADGVARPLPSVVLSGGEVAVPAGTLLLQDSALGKGPVCLGGAGAADYVSAGVVPITRSLLIGGKVEVHPSVTPQEPLVVPSLLLWFAALLPFWLLGSLLIIPATWLLLRRRGSRAIVAQLAVDRASEEKSRGVAGVPVAPGWATRREGPRLAAAYSHRLERLVGLLAMLTAFIGLAGIAGASTGAPPWSSVNSLHVLGDVGLWATVGSAVAILWFASGVRRSGSLRRQAGILWDVSTFWPRVAHPFGPPCYAERVVPEVTRRIREALAAQEAAPVILSGHSQGSTIAAAVATRLSDAELSRVRLVTYGSQLRAWFGRIFPAVFGPEAMGTAPIDSPWQFRSAAPDAPASTFAEPPRNPPPWRPRLIEVPDYSLRVRLQGEAASARWVNLFRRTDPLGFRVFSDRETAAQAPVARWQDYCISELATNLDVMTHSDYQGSEPYRALVVHWVAEAGRERHE